MSTAADRSDSSASGASRAAITDWRLLAAAGRAWGAGLSVGAMVLLIAWLYAPLVASLLSAWNRDPNYSHGPLVVLVAAGLAWRIARRRRSGRAEYSASSTTSSSIVNSRDVIVGFLTILVSLALHGVAWILDFALLDVASLIGLGLGLLMALGGRTLRRDFGMPLVLLIFAAPLPVAWYQPLALGMQQLVSSLAATVFAVCGLPVYREGYVIHLSGYSMQVGAACSGMRQLTAFLALAPILGHVAQRGRVYSGLLLLLSVVAAIGANLLRLLLCGVVLLVAGPAWAEGWLHTLEGLTTLGLGAVLVVLLAAVLARIQDRFGKSAAHQPEAQAKDRNASPTHAVRTSVSRRTSLVVIALLSIAVWVQTTAQRIVLDDAPLPAVKFAGRLESLPKQIGPWRGIDAKVPSETPAGDDHLYRVYQHSRSGQTVTLWITYSTTGDDRAHHPEICMAVAGQPEDASRRGVVPMPDGRQPIAEFVFGAVPESVAAWYWHYALSAGRPQQSSALARLYHRARSRGESVTVELLGRDTSPEGLVGARNLAAMIDQQLCAVLPPGAVRGSERLPVAITN
ncbi:MAG: exosortase [Planctomycetia bacterium]|nr:exosortase [Planctomycetia bacterium]